MGKKQTFSGLQEPRIDTMLTSMDDAPVNHRSTRGARCSLRSYASIPHGTAPAFLKEMSEPLTCGDLFAGAGGLSVGFHEAGFTPLFFNEIDAQAAATFSLNFPHVKPFVCPIQELSAESIRRECSNSGMGLDVMVGGPPCQGFSINAPIRSNDDPRNHLFRHYVRLVLEGLRPKFVVLENVPGLISHEGGRTLRDVVRAFEETGYRVDFRILNAAHYGVPQERWRLVLLGTRLQGVDLTFPEPLYYSTQRPNFTGGSEYTFAHAIRRQRGTLDLFGRALRAPVTVREAIGDLPPVPSGGGAEESCYTLAAQSPFQKRMREDSSKLYNHFCANVTGINLERMRHVKPGGSWRDIPHELLPKGMKRARRSDHTRRYGRLDPDAQSGTVLTKCDPHWGTVFHYEQERIVTVREAARFQSFPDWFRFTGSKADQYRQVGNAVAPLMALAIANHIKFLLLLHQQTSRAHATR